MGILFISTGGTIDKDYSRKAKTYNFEISEPAIRRILEIINPNFEYEIKSVLKKDSMDITEEDRNIILNEVNAAKSKNIIITHGTDTMINTAEKLSLIKDKKIVLVGSGLPEKFANSDAQFNIGFAVGSLGIIQEGVYIAMNGRLYKWEEAKKEEDTGQFIER